MENIDNKMINENLINYWMEKKRQYQQNLNNGIGDCNSIIILIERINKKLDKLIKDA